MHRPVLLLAVVLILGACGSTEPVTLLDPTSPTTGDAADPSVPAVVTPSTTPTSDESTTTTVVPKPTTIASTAAPIPPVADLLPDAIADWESRRSSFEYVSSDVWSNGAVIYTAAHSTDLGLADGSFAIWQYVGGGWKPVVGISNTDCSSMPSECRQLALVGVDVPAPLVVAVWCCAMDRNAMGDDIVSVAQLTTAGVDGGPPRLIDIAAGFLWQVADESVSTFSCLVADDAGSSGPADCREVGYTTYAVGPDGSLTVSEASESVEPAGETVTVCVVWAFECDREALVSLDDCPDGPTAGESFPLQVCTFGWWNLRADERLDSIGVSVVVDGVFTPAEADGVRAVQRSAGMPESGIIDPITWLLLFPEFDCTVPAAQFGLTEQDRYYCGQGYAGDVLDGIYGPGDQYGS